MLVDACTTDKKETPAAEQPAASSINRMPEEKANDEKLKNMQPFFTAEEMATITVLADIIIPKDDISGSASDAKVPEFIGYIVNEMTDHQTPMRGGLRWLDLQCLNRFGQPFTGCTAAQQIEMVDLIAYPKKATPDMAQGVSFFNLMRNLTATGFYSTKMGWDDIGYKGNTPNKWNGVPADVLQQYGVAYSEKELKECVSYDNA